MKVLSNTASGRAHGKVILIGEHAVVHQQPAIAIPFTSASVLVTIEEKIGETIIESIYHTGNLSDAPAALNNLIKTIQAISEYFKQSDDNMHITIESNIPPERGMGSSAAVATALVRALFNYYDVNLTEELLNKFVNVSEVIAHGNPSGLDAQVVRSNEAVYFIRGEVPVMFTVDIPGYLVLADTGDEGETIAAVSDVQKLINTPHSNASKYIEELGELTIKARELIEQKAVHALGNVMNEAQKRLKKLTVSNNTLDLLVETARSNGALGAKLTGGGRGGCMIALTNEAEKAAKIAHALENAGAIKTWIHPLGANIDEE
jgi:mevalonate kinase